MGTKLCISKQMVKTCLSKPLSIKQKSVEFVCISQPSTLARSLEKRALSGESLFQEISQLPTVFRKVEFEPVACKSEMSPSPSNLLNGTDNTQQNSQIGFLNSKLELLELELNHMII